ncbi:Excisionase [Bosea sp. 62]|uniref:helix-turn-helix domain-containing protein n=1 Tax=unclassified Bosea (in: a-proteobacteria) TaxID=2653178 RepID=UPI001252AE01|nr:MULTISPECIES: helix-turn-helix domain-containing protein [unclassified Bosea (in: a-proteobacteria)]CAD5265961.1 Excisionase [Bosea sp. 46]CAD5267933.1 Excisionase [Bosea sp. 21B]CAD5271004.1 Excisionase [Bosea sp. 7B]VVT55521.1 Excisionase [Bosea sp. EC-HK365B]VXB88781.1 Excisionase [Bosea sp. 29B]
MSDGLVTVEQAAAELNLHPKTVLRYIREGRLPATRVGKSYRIARSRLDAFAGLASGRPEPGTAARATCILDIPDIAVERAERIATFLQAVALTGDADTPPLHLSTAFDPQARSLKVVLIGDPADVGRLLEMLQMQIGNRP